MIKKPANSGFTLVELSIALIIIGLVIGGIFVGTSLIRNAKLQSVITDFDKYKKAIGVFKDKYHALPGDMPNATDFWGTDTNCPTGTPTNTQSPHITTCNGNGDGKLSAYNEWYRAWQHLASAGLIPGGYDGVSGTANSYSSLPGINVPASKIDGAGYTLSYNAPYPVGGIWSVNYNNIIYYGLVVTGSYTNGAVLTPQEALGMDGKIDDGLPASGTLVTQQYTAGNCVTSATASTATYNISYTTPACSFIYITGY